MSDAPSWLLRLRVGARDSRFTEESVAEIALESGRVVARDARFEVRSGARATLTPDVPPGRYPVRLGRLGGEAAYVSVTLAAGRVVTWEAAHRLGAAAARSGCLALLDEESDALIDRALARRHESEGASSDDPTWDDGRDLESGEDDLGDGEHADEEDDDPVLAALAPLADAAASRGVASVILEPRTGANVVVVKVPNRGSVAGPMTYLGRDDDGSPVELLTDLGVASRALPTADAGEPAEDEDWGDEDEDDLVAFLKSTEMALDDEDDDPEEDLAPGWLERLEEEPPPNVNVERVGALRLPSGSLVACDPVVYLAGADPFAISVAPGTYDVFVGRRDDRAAYAMLRLRDADVERWEVARCPGEEDAEGWPGYSVDSGVGCFIDEALVADLSHDDESGEFTSPFADVAGALTQTPALARSLEPKTSSEDGHDLVAFRSGSGPGVFASFWGLDAIDRPVCIVTDFDVIEPAEDDDYLGDDEGEGFDDDLGDGDGEDFDDLDGERPESDLDSDELGPSTGRGGDADEQAALTQAAAGAEPPTGGSVTTGGPTILRRRRAAPAPSPAPPDELSAEALESAFDDDERFADPLGGDDGDMVGGGMAALARALARPSASDPEDKGGELSGLEALAAALGGGPAEPEERQGPSPLFLQSRDLLKKWVKEEKIELEDGAAMDPFAEAFLEKLVSLSGHRHPGSHVAEWLLERSEVADVFATDEEFEADLTGG